MAGRNGVNVHAVEDEPAEPTVERAHVAVPEHSHPGESQSNGLAESAMKELIDQVRTLKMSLEYRLKSRLPNKHAVMAWLVEHAAYMLNRCKLGTDGRTAYGRLHGKESTARLCEFGERVLWYVPKKHRAKLDARWRYGVFLGRASNCDQNYLGLANGSIVTARAIARLVPSLRWSMEKVSLVTGVPMDYKTKEYDAIEEETSPHTHPEDMEDQEMDVSASRRLRVTPELLAEHGHTSGCRRCELHKQGLHARAKLSRHSEACRSRIYKSIKDLKVQRDEREDKQLETRTKSPKTSDEPKTVEPVSNTPKDTPMDAEPTVDLEFHAEVQSGGGDLHMADVEDSTEFYKEVDAVDDAFMGSGSDNVGDDNGSGDHEMIALMDVLQTLGVEPEEANRFSAKVMRISSQPTRPTFVEAYGCGNVVHEANNVLRNLNVDGLCAFDLRTAKSNGEPWNFSRRSDRKLALQCVKDKKPTWVIGSPPCTAFSRLQGLNFPKMDKLKVEAIMKEARQHLHFVIST